MQCQKPEVECQRIIQGQTNDTAKFFEHFCVGGLNIDKNLDPECLNLTVESKHPLNLLIVNLLTAQPTDTTSKRQLIHSFCYSTMTSLARGKLIAVIGDEDTCVGFLLGGIGELNRARQPNFLVVDKNVSVQEIENTFKSFVSRDDVAIILINQHIAEMIRYAIDDHVKSIPAVLEIPSKEHP
ncbi:putative V-type proton ATPase subunit [Trichinella spiralis]|uniref:V-type proton ATPase subunit n=1 Tax=Trichinella spiralis TaxID=6334 RepID=A0ABR3KGU8_TRISP